MTPQIENHLEANGHLSKKIILINNFLGGLAWGFGTVVGATAFVAILGYILKILGVFAAIQDILNTLNNLRSLS